MNAFTKHQKTTGPIANLIAIDPELVQTQRLYYLGLAAMQITTATVTDGNAVTADLEFYESTNNDSVNKDSLFDTYTDGAHAEGFNHARRAYLGILRAYGDIKQ